tara:strand:- start:1005 stop:1544 length:540 start_codon:yes stop_codon:yes gene_type:complete
MKKITILLLMLPFLTFGQDVKSLLDSDEYNVKNESYLKYNFQLHSEDNTSYKMKFFENVSGIEFWAHHNVDSSKGDRYLSILSEEYKVNLKGEQIQQFYNRIMSNYKTYQKTIRIQKPNVHLDVNLNEDGTLSFSSHMIGVKKSNYAFWLNKSKYIINEKDFLKLMARIRLYYDFKKVD